MSPPKERFLSALPKILGDIPGILIESALPLDSSPLIPAEPSDEDLQQSSSSALVNMPNR